MTIELETKHNAQLAVCKQQKLKMLQILLSVEDFGNEMEKFVSYKSFSTNLIKTRFAR